MKKVLCAFIQLQDFTLTDVTMNLIEWAGHFAKLEGLQVDIKRFSQYPFERNFNEICRYAIENEYDYIFQYDADMTGNKGLIEKLVSHDVECVGALFFSRQFPHKPQFWNVERDDSGDIKSFLCAKIESVKEAMRERQLLMSDVRGGGFTLFKVSALKNLSYPYAQFKPNAQNPYWVNGIDVDVTNKLSKLFGGVYTDCDPLLDVKHITYKHVSYADV